MAELSDKILEEIREENKKLLRIQMHADAENQRRHEEMVKAQKEGDKLSKKEVELTGIGAQFEKKGQEYAQDTRDRLDKDGPIAKKVDDTKDEVKDSTEKQTAALAKNFQKQLNYQQEREKAAKERHDEVQVNWVKDAGDRIKDMAKTDTLKNAVKADFSIIFGALGGLTSLPGIQTLMTGVKWILSNLLLSLGRWLGPKWQARWDKMASTTDAQKLKMGLISKEEADERRQTRADRFKQPQKQRMEEADKLFKEGRISKAESQQAWKVAKKNQLRKKTGEFEEMSPAERETVVAEQWSELKKSKGLKKRGFWAEGGIQRDKETKAKADKDYEQFVEEGKNFYEMGTQKDSIYAHDSKLYDLFKMPMKLLKKWLILSIANKLTGGAVGRMMGGAAAGAKGMLGKVSGAIGTMLRGLMFAIKAVASGVGIMIAAITSPIGLMVAGLILLGVGLYLAWDWIKEKWNAGVEKLKSFGAVAAQWFSDAGREIGLRVKMIIARMKDGIANIGNSIIQGINEKKKAWFGGDDIIDFRFQSGAVAGVQAERDAFEAEKASRGQQLADGTTALNEAKDKRGLPSAVAGGPNITAVGGANHTHQGAVLVTREGASDPIA